jgi:hypothetical protein
VLEQGDLDVLSVVQEFLPEAIGPVGRPMVLDLDGRRLDGTPEPGAEPGPRR